MNFFKIDSRLEDISRRVTEKVRGEFEKIDEISEYNQQKVLSAYINHKVSAVHLGVSTGYGYDDPGRETLEKIMADCMGAEDSLIRHSFTCGTHTLSVALFGVLRPGDRVLCLIGRPYDTITGVFGIDERTDGSLRDFGVEYAEIPLLPNGLPDENAIRSELAWKRYKMAYIQRSRGYSLRPSLNIDQVEALCRAVKEVSPETVIMVDNCYGEFTEKKEPCDVGADLCAGSLIKNPGGGIAPTGGYIAGRHDLVEQCAHRMTCAGVGREVGATLGINRELFMGLFSAPHVVGEALKTAVYTAALLGGLGFSVTPKWNERRGDIIECIILGSENALISFCQGLQSGAPVDSFVCPEPWDMPGYTDKVIMAAGAFTIGSSIELSADGPLRPPYAAWQQGGINFASAKAAILLAVQKMADKGAVKLRLRQEEE